MPKSFDSLLKIRPRKMTLASPMKDRNLENNQFKQNEIIEEEEKESPRDLQQRNSLMNTPFINVESLADSPNPFIKRGKSAFEPGKLITASTIKKE